MRSFGSDNNSGVHPSILSAIIAANEGHAVGYGDDRWTNEAKEHFVRHFGPDIEVQFVFNGTGANVVAAATALRPYQAIICSNSSHINSDECGAPEALIGAKLIDVQNADGKVRPADIETHAKLLGVVHHVQPRLVSITQSNELGLVYSLDEMKVLAETARRHHLYLHIDGARLSNAAAALNQPLRALTRDIGADLVSFGGTKNGMMFGEAVIIINPALIGVAQFLRKQFAQLASKMRYISAQFSAYLADDLWLRNAQHANQMAQLLAEQCAVIPGVEIPRSVQANAVFARIPRAVIEALQHDYFFYLWDEPTNEVRWMTSFDTTADDIRNFSRTLAQCMRSHRA